jgi:hypothetical protein
MLTIRNDQLNTMAAEWQRSLHAAYMARLRRDLPDRVAGLSEAELRKQVEDGCKAAEALAITEYDHVYRFLRLRYLPASVWERPGAQVVLMRVLTDTEVDAATRLRFVENNLDVERP